MSPTIKEIKTQAYDPLKKGAITQKVSVAKRAEARWASSCSTNTCP